MRTPGPIESKASFDHTGVHAHRPSQHIGWPTTARLFIVAFAVVAFVSTHPNAGWADAQRQGLPEPPPEALIAEIPFEPDAPRGRIFLNLAPDDHDPFVLMLDTGASTSGMTPLAAREAGVSVRRHKDSPYRRKTRLGRDLQFYVDTVSSDTGSATGWEYGLLGGNFLKDYVFELDFKNKCVRFYDPKKYQLPKTVDAPDEAIFRAVMHSNRPALEVGLGSGTVLALIDTGAQAAFIVGSKAASRSGIAVDELPDYGSVGTVRGAVPARLHPAASWNLGPFEFVNKPTIVLMSGWHNQATRDQSVLGYDSLQQFTMRIDYKRKRVWLRREEGPGTRGEGPGDLLHEAGVMVTPSGNDQYFVDWVAPDSPAHSLGLKRGDYLSARRAGEVLAAEAIAGGIIDGTPTRITRRAARGEGEWVELVLSKDGAHPVSVSDRHDEEEARDREWNSRVFVEVRGGWVRVEGSRLREGPRKGERFVTYEELLAIEEERASDP